MAASPSSSPRLPSPPPIAEDQLGPKSPLAPADQQQKLFSTLDHGASRRIRPGTKAEDMAEGPPLVELSEIESAFQLTEHLKALHNFLTHPPGTNTTLPVDRDMAHKLVQAPENVDKTLWLYELCRFLTQKVNTLVIALFSDNPPCSSNTCPEMRASEWQYLCAVHEPPKSCCAIDYCCHTLDWAANLLTSPKTFPSRLAMGTDPNVQHSQMRHLTNIFRRVYRIFAHAWFQHKDMFWKVEGQTGLYIFFKTVCESYELITGDNYTIPPEAEGEEQPNDPSSAPPPLILQRSKPSGAGPLDSDTSSIIDTGDHSLSTAGTTKRHRHSPSVGATSVHTVMEENEEEEAQAEAVASKEEPGASSDQESMVETPETSDEEAPEPEPPANEETEKAGESESAVLPETHASGETEKQTSTESGASEPQEDGSAPDAVVADKDGAATAADESAVPEIQVAGDAQVKSEGAEAVSAEPEKAEKDEAEASAAPDKDKATDADVHA